MQPTPLITPATLADVPDLVGLINRAYRGEASRQSWTTEAHLLSGSRIKEEQLRAMLLASNSLLVKCITPTDNLIGCAYLQQQEAQLYLSTLAVAPETQAQGVGRQLLAYAETYARQQSCPLIKISVLSARPELLAWYERHGYQRTGQREPFPDTLDFGQPRQPLVLLGLAKSVGA